MSKGNYSVIRCIPDAARGELFNIGIAIWERGRFLVDIDRTAARRAAKENPGLALDTFEYLSNTINERLLSLQPINKTKFEKMRKNQRGVPYLFAAPQFVNVTGDGLDHLAESLERLMRRLIGFSRSKETTLPRPPVIDLLEGKILQLISSGKVRKMVPLIGKKTNHPTHVDFKIGSTVLDVLMLDVQDDEAFDRRLRAEAYKIFDLKDNAEVVDYYVFPFTGKEVEQKGIIGEDFTLRAISSVEGKIAENIEVAERIIREAAEAA